MLFQPPQYQPAPYLYCTTMQTAAATATTTTEQAKPRAPRYYRQCTEGNRSSISMRPDTAAPVFKSWTPYFASNKIDATAPWPTQNERPGSLYNTSPAVSMIDASTGTAPFSGRPRLTLLTPGESLSKGISRSLAQSPSQSNFSYPLSVAQQQPVCSDRTQNRRFSYDVGNRPSSLQPMPSCRSSASEPARSPSFEPTITLTQPEGGVLEVLSPIQAENGGISLQHQDGQYQRPPQNQGMYTINEPPQTMTIDVSVTSDLPLRSYPYSPSDPAASMSNRRHSVDPSRPVQPPPTYQYQPSRPPPSNASQASTRPRPPPLKHSRSLKQQSSRTSLSSFNFGSPTPASARSGLATTTIDENSTTEPSASTNEPFPSPPFSFSSSHSLKTLRSRNSLNHIPSFRSSSTTTTPSRSPFSASTSALNTMPPQKEEINTKSPTTSLITLTNHIQTQTTQARNLFDRLHAHLPTEEATWMSRTIFDTQAATRDVLLLTEALRVDQAVRGGKLGLKSQVMWKVRDSRKAKEKRETLILCHGSLVTVLVRLQSLQEKIESGSNSNKNKKTSTKDARPEAGSETRRGSISQDTIASGVSRRGGQTSLRSTSASAPFPGAKPNTPPWDLAVQLQDPGMELVVDKPNSTSPNSENFPFQEPVLNRNNTTRTSTTLPVEMDAKPKRAPGLDHELLDMLSWRWNHGKARH
ncbi:hypothetical protein BDV18DRAFT_146857 [Aspergillus unguis]